MFDYAWPASSAVSWTQLTLTDTYQAEVGHTTQLRAAVESMLARGVQAPLPVVQAVSEYLPYLVGLAYCIEHDTVLLRQEPESTWRSILAPQNKVVVRGIDGEQGCLYTLYAIALCNEAKTMVDALGMYECDASYTTQERRGRDERLKVATDMLCRASGVWDAIATSHLPAYQAHASTASAPELNAEGAQGMAKLALGDAHALAIRKLKAPAKGRATDLGTAGPPLPADHPSASLLAKLHLHTSHLYDQAHALVTQSLGMEAKTPIAKIKAYLHTLRLDSSSRGDGVGAWLRYAHTEAVWHKCLAFKWLGIDAGEHAHNIGWGIAYLTLALHTLAQIMPSDTSAKLRRTKDSYDWYVHEHASIKRWLTAYQRTNEAVAFQRIPTADEVQLYMSEGRAALAPKTFTLTPAFGRQPSTVTTMSTTSTTSTTTDTPRTYAGADAYY